MGVISLQLPYEMKVFYTHYGLNLRMSQKLKTCGQLSVQVLFTLHII